MNFLFPWKLKIGCQKKKNNLFGPIVPWLFLFAEVVETGNCVVTAEEGNSVAAAGADVVNTVISVVVVVVVAIVADVVVVNVVTGVFDVVCY